MSNKKSYLEATNLQTSDLFLANIRSNIYTQNYPKMTKIATTQNAENTQYLANLQYQMSNQMFICFVMVWNLIGKPKLDTSIPVDFGYKKVQAKIKAVYPDSRGELFLYDQMIPKRLFEKLARLHGINSYGYPCLAYVLRNVYGEEALERLLDRIVSEKVIIAPYEFMQVLERWSELEPYPLKWSMELLSQDGSV